MTEQGEEVEMANRGVRNKDDHSERKGRHCFIVDTDR